MRILAWGRSIWRRGGAARATGVALVAVLIATAAPAPAAWAREAPEAEPRGACRPDALQPGGAVYRLCMPVSEPWNDDLVIWAHGYVDATRPVAIPQEQLCLGDTFCIPEIVNGLGFGFITTSYRMNGLVTTGVEDVAELVDLFTEEVGPPRRVYLVGASEGGLVTTLAIERRPDLFDGGLAACGPIGDFHRIVRYYGDFRVLFEYFFPGLLPGTPAAIPEEVIDNWDPIWEETIRPAVLDPANASTLSQLLKTARAPYIASRPETIEETVHDALWYNVFATNDIIAKLGGQPYDNIGRRYYGSADDAALNSRVRRIAADPAALRAIDAALQTTGDLDRPLVTLHTLLDQQVSFSQEILYGAKVLRASDPRLRVLFPSLRYGHCNFRPWEALLSFAVLVAKVSGQAPSGAEALLPDDGSRLEYLAAAEGAGILTPPAPPGD
jgi:pimeloyl-ACP methyl ester carboxylesterase